MSSMLYLAGRYFNVFGRLGTVTMSPAALSTAPKANLYDRDPSTPSIFGSAAADSTLQCQNINLSDPGFEDAGLTFWTSGDTGTGTSVRTTTAGEFRTGTGGLKISGTDASNYGSRYQILTVAAGEWRKATLYGRAPAAGTGKLYLKNLKTGNYYNGSAWASARAAAVSSSTTAAFPGTAITVTYQVESLDACREDYVSLKWELACESGTFCFDDLSDSVGVTFASLHGHNLGPVSALVESSDDGSAYTTRATMTTKRPAFFSTFAIIYAPYWRFKLSGTNHEAPYIGEAVLGQYQTSTVQPLWNPIVDRAIPGTRQFGTAARPSAYSYCTDPTESIGMEFLAANATAEKDLYDNLWLRSREGEFPVIVVPRDDETAVYFGHLMRPYSSARPFGDARPTSLYLIGAPFPTVGL